MADPKLEADTFQQQVLLVTETWQYVETLLSGSMPVFHQEARHVAQLLAWSLERFSVVRICALSEQSQKRVLSPRAIVRRSQRKPDAALSKAITELESHVDGPIRKYRNALGAHAEAKYLTSEAHLDPVERKDVDKAIGLLQAASIELCRFFSATAFDFSNLLQLDEMRDVESVYARMRMYDRFVLSLRSNSDLPPAAEILAQLEQIWCGDDPHAQTK